MASNAQQWWCISLVMLGLVVGTGCRSLVPQQIDALQLYTSPELLDAEPQIQRGEPRKVLDAAGWVWGIPSKILLWDRRVDNHRISPETEIAISDYLAVNGLNTVRVRLNQYRPGDDWRRLVKNRSVGAPWRYTVGTLSVLGETVLPGRLFGGDHFNPFTNTVHVYSDIPAIALHEAGHAKDFGRRKWKGSYAFLYVLPIVPLYHESIASRDAVAYLESVGTPQQQAEAYRILSPAYGTYVGSTAGTFLPGYANPAYYGAVVAGHAVGRFHAHQALHGDATASEEYTMLGLATIEDADAKIER
ncbi:hypothetical protein [Aureliella helgolandensis]|uniref:Uncharacterized protein n=1 Tax=Aureliella helgolandensis TaxID=2527968 RepID=A0A518GAC9_9BACT|nr:hypothetical protein [Aureliella helgolandensis]QDV25542.1 hypothetical protein Q31a_38680 [Aureliella helgolandensis]